MTRIVSPISVAARPRAVDPDPAVDPVLALTVFDKVFSGPLVATGVVHMVSTAVGGAPLAYVALERVEGELDGRVGAFVLQHIGTVTSSGPVLRLEVVAGSGTDGLAGITGTGTIEHTEAGAHLELDYELPA